MRVQATERLCGIRNLAPHICAANCAGVTHLPTAFAVKGRLVGDDRHCVRRHGGLHFDPVVDQRKHLTFTLARRVSGEFGRAYTLGNVEPHIVGGFGPRTLPSRPRALFLRGHCGLEASGINAEALSAQGVFGQIIGEAKGIVELERGLARQRVAGLHSGCSFVQKL